eukprot:scaffold24586_cov111-Isochrysis_galbana.AAC.4
MERKPGRASECGGGAFTEHRRHAEGLVRPGVNGPHRACSDRAPGFPPNQSHACRFVKRANKREGNRARCGQI